MRLEGHQEPVEVARDPGARGPVPRSHRTDSGIPLGPAYDAPPEGGRPPAGTYPYIRGISPRMYRDRLWHRDLYAGLGDVDDARARYRHLLEAGASGVSMALDLPTQLGVDSDDPEALAEVGKVGTALDTFSDVRDLFTGMPLDEVGTVFTVANGIGPIALAWFHLLGEHQGVDPHDYVIHLQNDPFKEFTGRGAFIFPVAAHVKLACDVVEYVARRGLTHWKPMSVCGSQYRWGGGDAVHEVGLGLATARVYIEELLSRGLDIDDFAPLLEMHLTADIDLFEEVAKFRAARVVWAEMMRRDYGAAKPESEQLRISLYTAGYRLTAQEPLNNSVRVTLQALAAVLGGVQHVGTLSIDEALSTPSQAHARLAGQTQNILAYETSIPSVADPLGGSWLVESLTDELARRFRGVDRDIQRQGGALKALQSGHLMSLVESSAYEFQRDIEEGRRTVVGVNRFVAGGEGGSVKAYRGDGASALRRQRARLARTRARRDGGRVGRALDRLEECARDGANLLEPVMEACAADATIGEITGRLGRVFGSWEQDGITL